MSLDSLTERMVKECKDAVEAAETSARIQEIRVKYLGKAGDFTALLKGLKDVPSEEKPAAGKRLNDARALMETCLEQKSKEILQRENALRVQKEGLDVTLSQRRGYGTGGLNPLTVIKNDIVDIFIGLGFSVKEGPEIEFDKYNFTALNIPKDHPSRNSSDTFYISDNLLLRTQTSAVQVHVMEEQKPPIRVVCPGKVYRPDDDATHSPMFHQIEGLVVDKRLTLCDLMGVLAAFATSLFSPETKVRFRPSHFPFTEPSVEADLSCAMCGGAGCRLCKGTGWIELLGAGVVHPAVLEMSGISSKEYSGIAFGVGVERAAMIKYGIPDIRLLTDNDIRILKQFK
jgi:phenylalanyl-tRNA synthetase alpha chain